MRVLFSCACRSALLALALATSLAAEPIPGHQLTLSDAQISWTFDWASGRLRSLSFENKLSGRHYDLVESNEVSFLFSAAPDRLAKPFLNASDFVVVSAASDSPTNATFQLKSASAGVTATVQAQLDGPTRRKWVELVNHTGKPLLLLDVYLDQFGCPGSISGGGGQGQPVFIDNDVFAAIEHPCGVNTGAAGQIQLAHFPGRRLDPGKAFQTRVALVSVSSHGSASDGFRDYIQAKSIRPKRPIAIYTPLGINNQWGACPTLDDEETLDVLDLLGRWRKQGARFDYFTLDAGWVDPASDLTKFRPTCYPNGPEKIIHQVDALGMKFGLWFATCWGTQSCWDYEPAFNDAKPPGLPYREGYPLTAGGITFCFASNPYVPLVKQAILYHVANNNVRFLKFDGGSYYCDNTNHGHLPGKYSVEPALDNLIDIVQSARAIAPDLFVMWYYGASSPFWALYGDTIFESGLSMEGSATSAYPTLFYRDSVTLAQDQNAQHARNIPPIVKDSLGVWLADNRWGNFMGKERWREALVMDLGRGDLLFPNLWGDLYSLSDDDVHFLAAMSKLAQREQSLFLEHRHAWGDPFKNDLYGYAYAKGAHGLVFLNNAHFTSRRAQFRLNEQMGLSAPRGTPLEIISHFPEPARVLQSNGQPFHVGDSLDLALRPFETLMLEVNPPTSSSSNSLPVRADNFNLGDPLALTPSALDPRMAVRFADASQFERQNLSLKTYAFDTALPDLSGDPPILAVVIRLRKGNEEWRYAPTVVKISQAIARVDDENVQLVPTPDSRQFGNTQSYGCSWVVFKSRLNPKWAGKKLKIAVHAWTPDGVEARVEAWVVKRWWKRDAHPAADGYYTDAPS